MAPNLEIFNSIDSRSEAKLSEDLDSSSSFSPDGDLHQRAADAGGAAGQARRQGVIGC